MENGRYKFGYKMQEEDEHEDGEVFLVGCMTTLENCFNQLVRKERNKKNRNNTSILFYLYI